MKRSADNKKVVAARVDPQIEQRLRLLAETTGRKQSFFLQQIIERGNRRDGGNVAAAGDAREDPYGRFSGVAGAGFDAGSL